MKDMYTYSQFRNEMSYAKFIRWYDVGNIPMHKWYLKYLHELYKPDILYKQFANLCQRDWIKQTLKNITAKKSYYKPS